MKGGVPDLRSKIQYFSTAPLNYINIPVAVAWCRPEIVFYIIVVYMLRILLEIYEERTLNHSYLIITSSNCLFYLGKVSIGSLRNWHFLSYTTLLLLQTQIFYILWSLKYTYLYIEIHTGNISKNTNGRNVHFLLLIILNVDFNQKSQNEPIFE